MSCRSITIVSRPASIAAVGRRVSPYSEWIGRPVFSSRVDGNAVVEDAADAVLGAEERHQRDAGRRPQHVDRARAVARAARVVGHEPDALAAQDARTDRRGARRCRSARAAVGASRAAPARVRAEVAARERTSRRRRRIGERGRHDGGDAAAQRRHVALAVGVHAVREEDDERAGERIDPERRPGPPGVPERADREELPRD